MLTLTKLPDHPLAQLFPMAEKPDSDRIDASLQRLGQLEEIVTLEHEGRPHVLDGRNRQDLLIARNVQPRYMDWTELPENLTKNGPLEYVKARNMDRRHLTKSQLGIVAAEYSKLLEKEAEDRMKSGLKQNAAPLAQKCASGDEFNQDNGSRPEDESQARQRSGGAKKKKTAIGKTSEIAGAAFGVSPRMVDAGRKLLKDDPKKAAAVKSGTGGSLTKAARNAQKEAAKAAELETALSQIASVGGKDLGAVMKKRKPAEVLELAGMKDDDIIKCRGVIVHGWTVSKARHIKMTALCRTHTIGDLLTRALAKGVAETGRFSLEITFDEVPFEIVVKRAK